MQSSRRPGYFQRFGWPGAVALALSLAVGSGCGSSDNLPREALSGTVKLDGKPLDTGQIEFYPAQTAANPITAGAPIQNGTYSISREAGLVPGSYTVRLSSGGEMPKKGLDENGMPGTGEIHAKERFPARYNTASTLKAEVKSGGPNTFDFDASTTK